MTWGSAHRSSRPTPESDDTCAATRAAILAWGVIANAGRGIALGLPMCPPHCCALSVPSGRGAVARLRLICSVGCLGTQSLASRITWRCFVSTSPDLPVCGSPPLWQSTSLAAGLGLLVGDLDHCPWPVPDRLPLMRDPVRPPRQEASVFLLRCRLQAWLVP